MAIRKFKSLEDALLAGYTIDLGNGKYAQGGETISRDKYLGLLAALPKTPPEQHDETFILPDFRDRTPVRQKKGRTPVKERGQLGGWETGPSQGRASPVGKDPAIGAGQTRGQTVKRL